MKKEIKKIMGKTMSKTNELSIKAYLKFKENDGMGTIEVVLIAVSLIALVVIFKDQVTNMLQDFLGKMKNKADTIF